MNVDEEREFGSRNLRTEDEAALSQVPAQCDCSSCPGDHAHFYLLGHRTCPRCGLLLDVNDG